MTMDKRAKRIDMKRALIYASAIVLAALWFAPVWFSLTMADKSNSEYVKGSLWGLPRTFSIFHNMGQAWAGAGLGLGFINSVAYGVFGAALAVLVAAMASYGLVVLRPKRRLLWFVVIFSGSVLPPQLYLIPVYRMYNAVGLYNTRIGLIIFYTAWAIPFATLVLRGYFSTIPEELVGAARVDGASELRIFRSIYMPMSVSALAVVFLFQFTAIWNDLLFGLVLSSSNGVRPVMPDLFGLFGTYSSSAVPVVLSGALLAAAPTVVLFFGLQKYFLRGLVVTFTR
jgi:multiple sugar transport system permease protein